MNRSIVGSGYKYSVPAFFLLTLALTWGLWIPAAFQPDDSPLQVVFGLLGAWAPAIVAIIISILEGVGALRTLLRRLTIWRVSVLWYGFALVWPVVISLLTTGTSVLLGQLPPDFRNPPVLTAYPAPPEVLQAGFLVLLPMAFLTQLFGSSLGEELGWRGFALPRLQAKNSPLYASILLGLFWGAWHLPRIWAPGEALPALEAADLIVGLVFNAIVYTWIFNNTRGSLLPVLLLHTSQALTGLFLAQAALPFISTIWMGLTAALFVFRQKSLLPNHTSL